MYSSKATVLKQQNGFVNDTLFASDFTAIEKEIRMIGGEVYTAMDGCYSRSGTSPSASLD